MAAILKRIIKLTLFPKLFISILISSVQISTQSVKPLEHKLFSKKQNVLKWWIAGKRNVSGHIFILTFILAYITTSWISPRITDQTIEQTFPQVGGTDCEMKR